MDGSLAVDLSEAERVEKKNYTGIGLKPELSLELNHFDLSLTDTTVLRIGYKIFNGNNVIDVRLWGKTKEGKLYPRKGKGLCLRTETWDKVLDIFNETGITKNGTQNK